MQHVWSMHHWPKSYILLQVLREVKALAGLQHTNIVGYNAAWLEYGSAVLPKSSCKCVALHIPYRSFTTFLFDFTITKCIKNTVMLYKYLEQINNITIPIFIIILLIYCKIIVQKFIVKRFHYTEKRSRIYASLFIYEAICFFQSLCDNYSTGATNMNTK